MSSHATAQSHLALTRMLALASLTGLIVLGLAWEMWLAPIRPGGSLLALKVLPLVMPLAGFLQNKLYTYRWVSLMVWLYFMEGAVRLTSESGLSQWLAGVEVILCLVLFTATALHVRWRIQRGRDAAQTG